MVQPQQEQPTLEQEPEPLTPMPLSEGASPSFDPSKYLMGLKGKKYLEVKWRVVWLNEAQPRFRHTVELLHFDDRIAIARATVALVDGNGITIREAQELGSQTRAGFDDYVEKASTAALGRALAILGYGTQFASELDEGAPGNIADSPVGRPGQQGQRPQQGGYQNRPPQQRPQQGYQNNRPPQQQQRQNAPQRPAQPAQRPQQAQQAQPPRQQAPAPQQAQQGRAVPDMQPKQFFNAMRNLGLDRETIAKSIGMLVSPGTQLLITEQIIEERRKAQGLVLRNIFQQHQAAVAAVSAQVAAPATAPAEEELRYE